MFYTEIAMFIAAGTITFSLFLYKILKYIIGIGLYSLYFSILVIKINNIELVMIIAFILTVISYIYYDDKGKKNPISCMLFILISTIGLFFLSLFFINVLDLILNKCIYGIKSNHFSPMYFNSIINKSLN